ncbi:MULTISPECIES: sulfite reductase flavoprotein subunit alpha [unclassified Pseudoxanthomonas]|uniref:sulfite reductase flavoprotein subunit alpha n=1 Tax=unclassified Pseudoxanthomonas TaxID=2645906 RepID=UPI0030769427
MTNSLAMPRPSRAALGNALILFSLIAIALALLSWNANADWWIAAPRAKRWFIAAAALVAYLFFCDRVGRRAPRHDATADYAETNESPVLVVYASQTGFAQALAERTAESLRQAGVAIRLCGIDHIDAQALSSAERALFVVSTTGEGDPPDHALAFLRNVMGQPASLTSLHYAVLALGDREYERFCGFGHQLDDWLRQHGAQSLFDIVEVDNADESALRHWQHHLSQLGDTSEFPDWTPPRYEDWTLIERRQLNPGSAGGGAFHLAIRPIDDSALRWQAGDIAEIGPCHASHMVEQWLQARGLDGEIAIERDGRRESLAELLARSHLPPAGARIGYDAQNIAENLQPLPHREYSIASLPEDGALHLLVRLQLRSDGSPGLGSGWLCNEAPVGGTIALRVRPNANFHPPKPSRPLILIGNGTGIAGLRAHLKARIATGATRNWLLLGERHADRDFFYGEEIKEWHTHGLLSHLDLAFSRDSAERTYVQDKLRQAADELREWVAEGAAIYVCGSLTGMAPGVDAALREILGQEGVEQLLLEGRYRRDVY